MENPARPFLIVVRLNSSLLGQLLPSKRYTALFVKDTIADFDTITSARESPNKQ